MKWVEAERIPDACSNCRQLDCYNCDVAGQRWELSREDALKASRKLLVRTVERLERKIAEIDVQLEKYKK